MRKAFLLIGLSILIILSVSSVSFSRSLSTASSTYRGDINEDSRVDIFDLLEMLGMLRNPEGQPERTRQIADMDESGAVNILDLLGLLRVLSGAQEPGTIYWEAAIDSLSQEFVDPGDTLTVYMVNLSATLTADSVKAYLDDQEVDLLEFGRDQIRIVIPGWFYSGELRLVAGADTTNGKYVVRIAGIRGINMVPIPAGSFKMGENHILYMAPDNAFVHTVSLDAFRMSNTEITNAQYAAYLNAAFEMGEITATEDSVIGSSGEYSGQTYLEFYKGYFIDSTPIDTINKSYITYDGAGFSVTPGKENWPVVCVTWYGAYAFARHYGVSLPTEAEWEYACRGGLQYHYGTEDGTMDNEKANYDYDPLDFSKGSPVGVENYPPNPFRLFEITGNAGEWCNDWYDEKYYSYSPDRNPPGAESGEMRVFRGGSWNTCSEACRAGNRFFEIPSYRVSYIGFRVVRR